MDKPIAVGDLVMVVRGHPCGIGVVFRVAKIRPDSSYDGRCFICGGVIKSSHHLFATMGDGEGFCNGQGFCLDRLKRIEPLSEPESVTEEATA